MQIALNLQTCCCLVLPTCVQYSTVVDKLVLSRDPRGLSPIILSVCAVTIEKIPVDRILKSSTLVLLSLYYSVIPRYIIGKT
jgi:hypothetical protein